MVVNGQVKADEGTWLVAFGVYRSEMEVMNSKRGRYPPPFRTLSGFREPAVHVHRVLRHGDLGMSGVGRGYPDPEGNGRGWRANTEEERRR